MSLDSSDDLLCQHKDNGPSCESSNLAARTLNVAVTDAARTTTKNHENGMSGDAQAHVPQMENEIWKKLQSFKIPTFDGDKKLYASWKAAFEACVGKASVSPELKLLQLRHYLTGEALSSIESLGYSASAYQVALERLERKYGGMRRQIAMRFEEIDKFPQIRTGRAKDMEKFADLLEITVVNLKDAGRHAELENGLLYGRLQSKLPTSLLAQYNRWRYERGKTDGVEVLLEWTNLEAEFLMSAHETSERTVGETTVGTKLRDKSKPRSYFGTENSDETCPCCAERHKIWSCQKFRDMPVDKRWQEAKALRLCYRCLGSGHRGDSCTKSRACKVEGCSRKHHHLLHGNGPGQTFRGKTTGNVNLHGAQTVATEGEQSQSCMYGATPVHNPQGTSISLRTVPVLLCKGHRRIRVNAVLDDGSTRSYVNEDVACALGISAAPQNIAVSVLNGQLGKFESQLVDFELESVSGNTKLPVTAWTMKRVTGNLQVADWRREARRWEHLKGIRFPRAAEPRHVDLLLGLDCAEVHTSLRDVPGDAGDPVARLTPLGWTCVGPLPENNDERKWTSFAMCYLADTQFGPSLEKLLRRFWELETTAEEREHAISVENRAVLESSRSALVYLSDRYQVCLPWKSGRPDVESNYSMALRRLYSTEKRLLRDAMLRDSYTKTLQDYEVKGYIRKLPSSEAMASSSWFLPHFPVVRLDKSTTKVRIVFDGSAHYNGRSLNDMLQPGPKLQQDLCAVLLRFRRYSVALVCDIKEMYLQVAVHPEDRPFQRFLWRECDQNVEPVQYEFNRVVFGMNSSPFLAQLVSREHAQRLGPEFHRAAETVLKSTYMDDSMDSVDTVKEGVELYQKLLEVWKGAGMSARKWLSNSAEVLTYIPAADRATQIDLSIDELPAVKTLGVLWSAESDQFSFNFSLLPDIKLTKRVVLKKVATIYDPLGFLAPFTIRAKVILQGTWASGVDWDDDLPEDLALKARNWFDELTELGKVAIPRCLQEMSLDVVEMHAFADASEAAYGAVVYLLTRSRDHGDTCVRFVTAKSRVAPVKSTSIPRLELLAAVLATELATSAAVAIEYPTSQIFYWSDSMDTLWWVRGRSRTFKTFVANRIGEIHRQSNPSQWQYVTTIDNPADVVSRGCSAASLVTHDLWWNGPTFLRRDPSTWPVEPNSTGSLPAMKEVRQSQHVHAADRQTSSISYTTQVSSCSSGGEDWRLDPLRFSSWTRLVRVLSWVRRFMDNCRRSAKKRFTGELTIAELHESEVELIKQAQLDVFQPEIRCIERGKELPSTSKLLHLRPTVDDEGLVRCQGRLQFASFMPRDTVFPIILPRKHQVTKLIIKHAHDGCHHAMGTNYVLSQLSAKYWILSAREAVKEVERDCATCRRRDAQPGTQVMAPLPVSRIQPCFRAFAKVGVDYAGPFVTTHGRGKARTKRWLCLFTCLATRAVHLELAFHLDTDSFLNCFFRMVSRRGVPEEVLSDNGTNFVGAVRELRELWNQVDKQKVQAATSSHKVKWSFNPPSAPHFGGPFESMVKSAKRALYHILGNSDIDDEALITALAGAEHMINSRPLTTQSVDPRDETPLTPNHFIFGQLGGSFAPDDVGDQDYHPRKRWRRVQELLSHFWKRWIREWLPRLSARSKWCKPYNNFAVGDVVLVMSPDTPRGKWPLGRVMEVYPGKDGFVRVVKVLVNGKEISRPISKLCPLEVANIDKS